MSVAVAVKDDLAREVRAVAEQEGLPLEEFVERALLHQLTWINRRKLRVETEYLLNNLGVTTQPPCPAIEIAATTTKPAYAG